MLLMATGIDALSKMGHVIRKSSTKEKSVLLNFESALFVALFKMYLAFSDISDLSNRSMSNCLSNCSSHSLVNVLRH